MEADWFTTAGTYPAAAWIRKAAKENRLTHSLLLTGTGNLLSLAKYTAAAHECSGIEKPCGVCGGCRKVRKEIHPDVAEVKDAEHKTIAAEVVREICADAWIQPNEGLRKVYIFPDCALLTERDQNILLKTAEEGPAYAAYIFCARTGAQVLPTLRSRCVEVKVNASLPDSWNVESGLHGSPDAGRQGLANAGLQGLANTGRQGSPDMESGVQKGMELCRRILKGNGSIMEWAVGMEKSRLSRDELEEILNWCVNVFSCALLSLYVQGGSVAFHAELDSMVYAIAPEIARNLNRLEIASVLDALKKYYRDCIRQVGTNHLLGALAAELEGIR